MMSLFSSFDLIFFSSVFASIFLFFALILLGLSKISVLSESYNLIFSFLDGYLSSLSSEFFKFLDSLFLYLMALVFFVNLLSILPFNFSLTSQLSCIFWLSLSVWGGRLLLTMAKNLKGLLSHFIPEGAPLGLSWFLFCIEIVSNFIRPVTLTVRLLANILAGHLLMILLSKMVFLNLIFLPLYLGLNTLEIFVSLIQAYIFMTMSKLYHVD